MYLVSTTEVYRIDSEAEVKAAIEAAKKDNHYSLTKYMSEYKETKLKGEVVDAYYKVTLTKAFNNIKEPDSDIKISYHSDYEE